jgi:hypothetical protein
VIEARRDYCRLIGGLTSGRTSAAQLLQQRHRTLLPSQFVLKYPRRRILLKRPERVCPPVLRHPRQCGFARPARGRPASGTEPSVAERVSSRTRPHHHRCRPGSPDELAGLAGRSAPHPVALPVTTQGHPKLRCSSGPLQRNETFRARQRERRTPLARQRRHSAAQVPPWPYRIAHVNIPPAEQDRRSTS